MTEDRIDPETLAGMLKKAARTVERAAKHPEYGSQTLWEISATIKREAARILNGHKWCHPEFHRCDGGGSGEHARYVKDENAR